MDRTMKAILAALGNASEALSLAQVAAAAHLGGTAQERRAALWGALEEAGALGWVQTRKVFDHPGSQRVQLVKVQLTEAGLMAVLEA